MLSPWVFAQKQKEINGTVAAVDGAIQIAADISLLHKLSHFLILNRHFHICERQHQSQFDIFQRQPSLENRRHRLFDGSIGGKPQWSCPE